MALRLVVTRERLTGRDLLFAVATFSIFWSAGSRSCGKGAAVGGTAAGHAARGRGDGALRASGGAAVRRDRAGSGSPTILRRQAADVPPPDVIYSIIREPHHQSPFLSGCIPAIAGCPVTSWQLRCCSGALAWLGVERPAVTRGGGWVAELLAYLFLVLGPKFLDRTAACLEVLPVPSVVAHRAAVADAGACRRGGVAGRPARLPRVPLVAMIGSIFLYVQGGRLMGRSPRAPSSRARRAVLVAAVTTLTDRATSC